MKKGKIILFILIAFLLSPNQIKALEEGFKDEHLSRCIKSDDEYSKGIENITTLDCTSKGIIDTSGIEQLTELKILNLSENQISTINLENNKNLTELNLSGNKINTLNLESNKNLKYIYLNSTGISNITFPNYENKDTLTALDLSASKLTNNQIQEFINNFPNLHKFSSTFNNLTTLNVSSLPNLTELNLSGNKITTLNLENNKNLKYIYLNSTDISSITFPNYENKDTLTALDISGTKLTTTQVQEYINNFPNLHHLAAGFNNITEINVNHLEQLTELKISGNRITSLNLKNNRNLEKITMDAKLIQSTEFNTLSNLNINLEDHAVIPVYGTTIQTNIILQYIPSFITLKQYEVYDSFQEENQYTKDNIEGRINQNKTIRIHANEIENKGLDSSVKSQKFDGYYTITFLNLTSEKYPIDEKNSTIIVGQDSDDEIKNNIKASWGGNDFNITNEKLILKYNNQTFKEFQLIREEIENKCTETKDHYYDKFGNSVSKEEYLKSCGLVENPQTGRIVKPLIFIIILIGTGIILKYIKKNQKLNNL